MQGAINFKLKMKYSITMSGISMFGMLGMLNWKPLLAAYSASPSGGGGCDEEAPPSTAAASPEFYISVQIVFFFVKFVSFDQDKIFNFG